MATHIPSRLKLLFTFLLPFSCLLSPTAAAATATVHLPPSSSSALLAADILRGRGYSLFASAIVSLSLVSANFSGTILAPPDFAFSSAAAMLLNNRRPPPRPSVSLLLYHTLKPPLVLTWAALSSRDDRDELRTLYDNNCLYVFRSPYGGEVSISSSLARNPLDTVQIRQPDIYVDDYLTVHGVDGVLDPSYAAKCISAVPVHPTARNAPSRVNRTLLDHAMRGLWRTGYSVVAAAMGVRRAELLSLTSVTVFAVSDKNLFLKPDGFRYDFRHHVVPLRRHIADLAGIELPTLVPNKTIVVESVDGAVTVNGVEVDTKEVYRSRWIVVFSIATSLDDLADSDRIPPIICKFPDDLGFSPPPFSGVSVDRNFPRVSPAVPPYAPETENSIPSIAPASFPPSSTDHNSEIGREAQNSVSTPAPSAPVKGDDCVISKGMEGGDLFCPVTTARRLQETEGLNGEHVEGSNPSNGYSQVTEDLTQSGKVKFVDSVNIADDIFFYT